MKTIIHKNKYMLEIEQKLNQNIEEVLRCKFVDENKPAHQIATELNISYVTVLRWLALAGVRSRRINLGDN